MENGSRNADVEALIREIQRYLVLVEALRAGGLRPPLDMGGKKDA